MRDGGLSYAEFCAEAVLLAERSHELARVQAVGADRCVATWEWRHGNRQHLDGDSYLVSTGNVRKYNAGSSARAVSMAVDGDLDELLLLEDETSMDEDVAAARATEPESPHTADATALLEFHIVYHTIFETPVLYFRASAIDGTPLPANVALGDVQLPGAGGRPTFVSMEEHPVLGKPYFFLHPCETATAMHLLQDQQPKPPSDEPSFMYLASWLSLVQPLGQERRMERSTAGADGGRDGVPRQRKTYAKMPPRGACKTRRRMTIGNRPPVAPSPTKYAFGSRLPMTVKESSRDRGSSKAKAQGVLSAEKERKAQDSRVTKKRRMLPPREGNDSALKVTGTHGKAVTRSALPMKGSHLPMPTKVSNRLGSSLMHASARTRPDPEGEHSTGAEREPNPAQDPAFWRKRHKAVLASLEKLERLEERILKLSQ